MGRFKDILKETAAKTNAELASDISSLTSLKDSQINYLFPTKSDKENLLRLLSVVNSSTSENDKINQLKKNFDDLASTVIKLVKVLV